MMPYLMKIGCLTVTVKHLKKHSSGLFYFRRGIPKDLRVFYHGKHEINHSLKTHSEKAAIEACQALSAKYTDQFRRLRSSAERDKAVSLIESYGMEAIPVADQFPAEDLNSDGHPYNLLHEDLSYKHDIGGSYSAPEPHEQRALDILNGEEKLTLQEVCNSAKGAAGSKKRQDEIERSFRYFLNELPTSQLHLIRRKKVQDIADNLSEEYQVSTVKKAIGIVRKAVRQSILTHELTCINPFESISIMAPRTNVQKKETFSDSQLLDVKDLVLEKLARPTARAIGLLINTGARCGEIAGLRLEDIDLDNSIPHLTLIEYEDHTLKTIASQRRVPLVGISLEIAKLIKEKAEQGQKYAFPNWNKNDICRNDSCSGAVNKLLKTRFPLHTSHCFRHTMKDRLAKSNARGDLIDSITGWKGNNMRDHYGKADLLELQRDTLVRVMEFEGNKL